MPVARVQTPDGRVMRIEVPQGASERDILDFAQQQFSGMPQQADETPAEQPQEPVGTFQAIGRAGVDSFMNNILGIPEALANVPPSPTQLGGQIADRLNPFNVPSREDIANPQIEQPRSMLEDITGSRELPLPDAGDVRAGVRTVTQGQPFGEARQAVSAEEARMREEAPIASGVGGALGDAATLLTGRAPLVRGAQRRATARAAEPVQQLPAGLRRTFNRALNSKSMKGLANRAGRSVEAGLEGAALAVLQDGDAAETAAFAAGGQAAGSLALAGIPSTGKGALGLMGAALGVTAIIQLTKSATPGGNDFILPSIEAGFDKVKWALAMGAMAGLAGAGRIRGKTAEDLPLLMDGLTAVPRGAVISLIEDWRAEQAEGQNRIEPVINKLASDPEYFQPAHRRRLERAIKSGQKPISSTIDDLMEIRSFRRRFEALEVSP